MGLAEIVVLVALTAVVVGLLARGVYVLRGPRLVTCPETGGTVAVDLDLKYSAVHSVFGRPHFRLADCTRWPEKAGCGQMCLADVEAAPKDCLARTIAARWYEGKECAYCRRAFGEIHWHDHAPALVDAEGVTRQWTEIPAERLHEVLATHLPVCWNCHVAGTFRRLHPGLVVDRPPRPLPPVI